jgi:glycerol dehydrogenase
MDKIILSPSKYVQGYNIIERLESYTSGLGKNSLVIADDFIMKMVKEPLTNNFKDSSSNILFEKFNGECSMTEINRLTEIVNQNKIDSIVGIGGGKTLDTAKAVSYYGKIPVVIIPTIASTDAPCSALSVVYTDEGVFSEYLFLTKNPDLVIMDTKIIANAPVRLLTAGMGDALATYFEARACTAAGKTTMAGGIATKAAVALAELCYNTLLSDGYTAKLSAENKVVTKSLENIIEANTYLSGIGFESGGLAAAHAVHNGLTVIEELHHLYHGEKVAFGVLVQLVLENAPQNEVRDVLSFCKKLGLPTSFKDMGIENISMEKIYEAAKLACAEGETIYNMPFHVTVDDVYAAILTANSLGNNFCI